MSNSYKKPIVNNALGVDSQKEWKNDYNRQDRRQTKQQLQNVSTEEDIDILDDEGLSDIKKTAVGDIWNSPSDGKHYASDEKYTRK